MPIYNEFYYSTGYYGTKSPLAFSARPVTATAIDYSTVEVSWNTPSGSYSNFRVVRSQRGYPQTQEDGVIIYSSVGAPTTSLINDTSSNLTAPLVPGRFTFYRTWVQLTSTSDWVQAGDAFTLVPSPHTLGIGRDAKYSVSKITSTGKPTYVTGDAYVYNNASLIPTLSTTHDRFMETLPRVITTSTNSGTDVVNNTYDRYADNTGYKDNSLISTFLSAFSFTLDEFMTFTQLIAPSVSLHYSAPMSVYLGSQELGMTQDVETVTNTQRLLLRNAVQIYSEKGTTPGLQLLVQSMTGYAATLSDTVNLLLSHEDSTFDIQDWQDRYNSAVTNSTSLPPVGNWTTTTSNVSLSVVSDQEPLTSSTVLRTLDTVYCAKINPSATNQAIALGTVDPINRGVPVTAGLSYSFSMYAKEGAETEGSDVDNTTVEVKWYDKRGLYISSSSGSVTIEGGWAQYKVENVTAPTNAVYVGIVVTFVSQNYPMYIDMVQFEQSSTATSYQEPRGVIITLAPSKINYIKNPSFLVNTTGWAGTNASLAQVATTAFTGTTCLSATSNGSGVLTAYASDYIPVTVGNYYSGSIYVKDANTAAKYTVSVKFYNGTTLITTAGGTMTSAEVTPSTTGWTRLSISGKAPANATQALLYVQSTTTPANNSVVYFDAAQFEQSNVPTDYFDGYLTGSGSEWQGDAASAAYSGNYPARSVRLGRLKTEIESYIGFGTPYYIDTYKGPYVGGIS